MRVLTVNAGSHSLRLAVVDSGTAGQLVRCPPGEAEPQAVLATAETEDPPGSRGVGEQVRDFLDSLPARGLAPQAVAHRIVHGGDPERGGPGALVWLLRHGIGVDELEEGLQHRSGMTALSGGLGG